MQSAFGRAMLESTRRAPKHFQMRECGGRSMSQSCGEFLTVRPDERQLLDGIDLPEKARVLDYGCGVGRHLLHLRERHPSVECNGIDVCDLLLDHCRNAISQPSHFFYDWNDLIDPSFDLILLLGNNLGVLGDEENAKRILGKLIGSLRAGGRILVEAGNPFGTGYSSKNFTIEYAGQVDGPFCWGFADERWLRVLLEKLGCSVVVSPSSAPGGRFFFASARKDQT